MSSVLQNRYKGVFILILINFAMFLTINIFQMPLEILFLNNKHPKWFQFFTSLFCHGNFQHLSGNMFFLYIFGRLIEEEEGLFGVLCSYLVCGIGANIVAVFFGEFGGYSLGASGSIFGLFTIAMMLKFKPNLFSILEILILAPFVVGYIMKETKLVGNADNIAHGTHISGAVFGVLLIFTLKYLSKKGHS